MFYSHVRFYCVYNMPLIHYVGAQQQKWGIIADFPPVWNEMSGECTEIKFKSATNYNLFHTHPSTIIINICPRSSPTHTELTNNSEFRL